MEPVAGYLFMWPWMAEVGLEDVIAELAQEQTLAVVIVREGSVWGLYDTNEYLRPLNEFLQETYAQTDDGIYISPALAARCAT
jgi:hypothetical protein